MDFEPFIAGVRATGFPFENFVAEKLREHKWQIISNRYYVDDDENKPREIDILAYKASTLPDFDLRTAVIISCKKSEAAHWAFLTRAANHNDPNSNWQPFHYYTDHKPLAYQLSRDTWEEMYHSSVRKLGVKETMTVPDHEVFAMQELLTEPKKLGVSRGDASIFASVQSTIKALLYEKSARGNKRRNKPRVYQFNSVCLTDGKFIKLHFDGEEIKGDEIDSMSHIARYIAKREDVSARVCFSTKDNLKELLDDLDRLHRANVNVMRETNAAPYDGVLEDYARRVVLIDDFRNKLHLAAVRVQGNLGSSYYKALRKANIWSRNDSNTFTIGVPTDDEPLDLEKLNQKPYLDAAKTAIKDVYRSEVECVFDEDFPF
ncbi:hypothetical protein [Caballeronia sp. HLA56]